MHKKTADANESGGQSVSGLREQSTDDDEGESTTEAVINSRGMKPINPWEGL